MIARCVTGALVVIAACHSTPPRTTSTTEEPPAKRTATERVIAATAVLHEVSTSADGVIPVAVAHAARCVAVVPGLIHAGLVVSARAGHGVVTCRSPNGWTDPKFFVLNGASAGLTAGVQSVDLVMLAMTETSATDFLSTKLQLGASTSFAAGPIGRNLQASSDVNLAPILYYSRAQGLFVGLDLAGISVDADEESARAFYGDARDFGVLLRGSHEVPAAAARLRDEVERLFAH